MKYETRTAWVDETNPNEDLFITVIHKPSKLEAWLGIKPYEVVYRGSSTVWYEYPSGNRASTYEEAFLSKVWTRERWRYKDAVKNAAGDDN